MLFSIVLFLMTAAFSVDVAYMQMIRTDLRAATDAAAKAGAAALSREQDDNAAIQAAIDFAAANTVGGRPLLLEASDIEIGEAELQEDGSWSFSTGGNHTAVRVTSRMSDAKLSGSVPLFFGSLFGINDFTPERISTASYFDQEICLVIDRSHSMCFDLTGVAWSYPPGTPIPPFSVAVPAHDSLSRWAALEGSIDLFLSMVNGVSPRPQVGLVTWASEMDTRTLEYLLTRRTSPVVTFDVPLDGNFSDIVNSIRSRGDDIMIGGTNMRAGIEAGLSVLTGDGVRPFSQKSMVLMSDGQWNTGGSPIAAAQQARQDGIVIHTISFIDAGNQRDMERIAEITGGRHYYASNEAELRRAFEELARLLPATLTD